MKLPNKVALITGSSRGVGKAVALLFAKEGARVVINYVKSEEEANRVVEMVKKLGSEAVAIKADVSNENQVQEMFDIASKSFGEIDILVNNAGIVIDKPFKDRTIADWQKTLGVNLIGPYLCSKYALPYMKNGGKIVNISSTNAINSFSPDAIDYDASKAGIILLTKDLAKQLAPKIQVNAVAPGWINTDMNKDLPEEFIKKETNKIYLKRMAEPEEIAKAILFLASDDASFITGSVLIVDGGHD